MKRSRMAMVLALSVVLVSLAVGPAVGSKKQYKIGVNNFGQANFFGRIGRESMIDEAKKLGHVPISTVTDTVPARMSAIENMIAQGCNAILIQEGDIKMVEPALREAKRRGIVIVSVDSGTSPLVDIVVESNNWLTGILASTYLLDNLGGDARIVEIYNDLGQMIRMRRKMLHAVMTEYPGSKIIAGFTYNWPDFFPDVKAKTEAVLQANPKKGQVNAIYATFDGAGAAAAQAIREAGRQGEIIVVGIDGDPVAYEEMRRPDSPFVATVALDPDTIAREAVRRAVALLDGDKLAAGHYYISCDLVTREQVRANPGAFGLK